MRVQPWPAEALPLRQSIQVEQERLRSIFEVCLAEGIEEQNYRLIKDMLPKITTRAERIQVICRQIRQLMPYPRHGREPKWAIAALDINGLADRILKCVEMIQAEYPANRFITIGYLLNVGRDTCRRIEQHLAGIPAVGEVGIEVPAAFRQAFEAERREH